jgi:group I intron endonuclease
MENVAYIYSIENKVNGNCYIGSTVNYKSRWRDHKTTLRHGRHHSFILQKAWNKYGEENFEFKLLLICEKKDKIDYENCCMKLQSYNVLRTVRETPIRKNWIRTEEVKARMSAGMKKAYENPEFRAKLSAARTGYKQSKESIQKSAIAKWKSVYCKELEITFSNQKQAAEYFKTSVSNISQSIARKGKVGGKFTLVRVA